jgi:TRAP-type mannitol/chloroaromatic compound transport system substrate-binding protein
VSNRAIAVLVLVAFMVGLVASLAVRPPGTTVATASGDAALALEPVTLKLPVAYATDTPVIGDIMPYVADLARRASAGLVDLQIFEPGKLVPPLSITEAVKEGKIEAGFTWLGYDQGKIPAAPLLSAAPFGPEPWEFIAWWYEGGGRELAEEAYAEHGIHPILCLVTGPETAGWFRNEVTSVQDLDGLKIRFAGLGGRVLQKLGASVTVLPPGEIFPALEKGAIDASEFSMPVIDRRMGFDRVAKFNYYPGWHQIFSADHVVINKTVWDGLNGATQAVIESACSAGVARSLARSEALQGPAIAGFAENGVRTLPLPADVLQQLKNATAEVMAEEAARNPMFKKVYESQQAFAAKYQDWKRLGYLPRDF